MTIDTSLEMNVQIKLRIDTQMEMNIKTQTRTVLAKVETQIGNVWKTAMHIDTNLKMNGT